MIVQLVSSGRGVACLPNWVLEEYVARRYVVTLPLGDEGVWPTLYAAVRTDLSDAAYVRAFTRIARETCFERLVGIRPARDGAPAIVADGAKRARSGEART